MKKAIVILQWLVGLLFIFSGLVKINDPLGLSYKMEEFFEVWHWLWLKPYSLHLSVTMNVLEVVSGMALLLGWQKKWNTKFLLLLMLFFTFLTGYAVLSGKIKTCGCFGDCLPLTAQQSFIKDIILLIAIILLTIYQQFIKVLGGNKIAIPILIGVTFIAGDLQFLVLKYLPYVDCLPYKKGNNIIQQMQKPVNYLPDSIAIEYSYTKAGKSISFMADNFPANFDSTYVFVGRKDKLIRKGANLPAIQDFTLMSIEGADTTTAIFNHPKAIWIMGNVLPTDDFAKEKLTALKKVSVANSIPIYYITSQAIEELQFVQSLQIPILKADATIIKTAARVNPTIFLMNGSTIKAKNSIYHYDMIEKNLNSFIK